MKYHSFSAYVKKYRYTFNEQRFESDEQYRAVVFHQFGSRYRRYCQKNDIPCDYIDLAFVVQEYENRNKHMIF